jgi:NADH:ubiquinone reductase (H+-translocating)
MKQILILGGGFAGVYAFLELQKRIKEAQITLVSKTDRFLFSPMMHEVATGNLLPSSITQPLRMISKSPTNQFIEGEVREINADTHTTTIRIGGINTKKELRFDYLILALGADTSFFGVPGADEYALTLKDMRDAETIKNRMITMFERALWEKDEEEQKRLLHFVIIGGGPTGVELAGEMADFLNDEFKHAFPILTPKAKITLIQSGNTLLHQVDKWFGARSEGTLEKMGVSILFGKRVTRISKTEVHMGEESMPTGTTVWTAGIKANEAPINAKNNIEYESKTNRIKVNNFLQIEEYPYIFTAGDQAWVCDKETGQPYPMRAQFAVREGHTAAKNITNLIEEKPLEEFKWKDQGFIVSLGKGSALAGIAGIKFSGFPAWGTYRAAYLFKLVGLRAKVRTAIEWTLNLFLRRDISKL